LAIKKKNLFFSTIVHLNNGFVKTIKGYLNIDITFA